jgi:hypothetical protein
MEFKEISSELVDSMYTPGEIDNALGDRRKKRLAKKAKEDPKSKRGKRATITIGKIEKRQTRRTAVKETAKSVALRPFRRPMVKMLQRRGIAAANMPMDRLIVEFYNKVVVPGSGGTYSPVTESYEIDNYIEPKTYSALASAVKSYLTRKKVTPVKRKPVIKKPVARRPVTRKPVERRPVTRKPVERRPVTRKPVTRKPVERRPVTRKPVVKSVKKKPVLSGSAKELNPLYNLRHIMRKALAARGVETKGLSFTKLVIKFYNQVVVPKSGGNYIAIAENFQSDNFVDPATLSAVVAAIAGFIRRLREKKKKGEPLTEEEKMMASEGDKVVRDIARKALRTGEIPFEDLPPEVQSEVRAKQGEKPVLDKEISVGGTAIPMVLIIAVAAFLLLRK